MRAEIRSRKQEKRLAHHGNQSADYSINGRQEPHLFQRMPSHVCTTKIAAIYSANPERSTKCREILSPSYDLHVS